MRFMNRRLLPALFGILVGMIGGQVATAIGPDPDAYHRVVERGLTYLVEKGQAPDGSFSSQAGIGPTGLAVAAMLRNGRSVDDPAVQRGLKWLLDHVQQDGGIYSDGSLYKNYETSIALMCLSEANRDGRYEKVIRDAERFVKGIQWDEGEGKTIADREYGGAGYGSHKRPDLSNTSFLIDALRACGNGPDDPAIQKALIFVSRCQNLETEHNTTPFASKNPDGGFYYTCAGEGESKAGTTPNGGLRSYASMTYAGLKSMIYAGVSKDDPRVKAATEWIRKFYDLSSNPGMGMQGLYYYYHVFAKTMDALGEDEFVDAQGKRHDWRRELFEVLAEKQQPDGSWVNEESRWLEGDPNLVTSYALLALSYLKP
ncbi:terpene cyclase/mutase family protein [Thermostilla marina]